MNLFCKKFAMGIQILVNFESLHLVSKDIYILYELIENIYQNIILLFSTKIVVRVRSKVCIATRI